MTTRVGVTDDHALRDVRGIELQFDAAGHLVAIRLSDAKRLVPERLLTCGEGLFADHDREAGAAYLYLQPIGKGGVAETLAFEKENDSAAWGVNLDFDAAGRLIGIEFESDELAPSSLLRDARPI